MAGIVFLKTRDLTKIISFYSEKVGMTLWLDQGGCIICRHGNLLLGFCQADTADREGVITFFYPTPEAVDNCYTRFKTVAETPPKVNPEYRIYHFYARDPEGRSIEFQHFQHDLPDLELGWQSPL
jgi:catechol-2,3-dioxygenase